MSDIEPITVGSPFLSGIIAALTRRSKALKHKNVVRLLRLEHEQHDALLVEKLTVELRRRKQRLILEIWDDRTVWLHACESIKNAGWKFQFTSSGRFLGECTFADIVQRCELSLAAMFEMDASNVFRLRPIWQDVIAAGPTSVSPKFRY